MTFWLVAKLTIGHIVVIWLLVHVHVLMEPSPSYVTQPFPKRTV